MERTGIAFRRRAQGFAFLMILKQKRHKKKGTRSPSDCRQKAILPPAGGRIALSANERIAEFLDFAIQAKFAYVNKLRDAESLFLMRK